MISTLLRHGLAVALLCLATFAVHELSWRFETRDDSLTIAPPDKVPQIWMVSPQGVSEATAAEGGGLLLDASGSRGVPYVLTMLRRSKPFSHVRVEADVRIEKLRPGDDKWQRVGVLIFSYGDRMRSIGYWPKQVLLLDEDQPWSRQSRVFPLHEATEAIRLMVYNAGHAGRLGLREITLVPLYERPLFLGLRYLVIGLWLACFAYGAWRLIRLEGRKAPKAALVLMFALATAAIVMPQPHYGRIVYLVESTYAALTEPDALPQQFDRVATEEDQEQETEPEPQAESQAEAEATAREEERSDRQAEAEQESEAQDGPRRGREVRFLGRRDGDGLLDGLSFKEVAHFSIFVVLAFAALLTFRRQAVMPILTFTLFYAVCSEFLQLFLATRSTSLSDFVVNALGVAVGALLFLAIRRRLPAPPGRSAPLPGGGAHPGVH